MSKQEELLRRCEKLMKTAKKSGVEPKNCPCSCNRCLYHRPDFKYRNCQFSRCPFGKHEDVFRKKPLRRDKFSGREAASMHV